MNPTRSIVLAIVLAALGASGAIAQQTQTMIRFQNRFRPNTWLHTERGPVEVTAADPGWWSADWIVEPVAGEPANVRLRNRFRPNTYLHNQNGRVEVGPLGDPGWWSAQWMIMPVAGTPYVRLRNRWKPNEYLHTERTTLESGPIDMGWWSAMWTAQRRIEPVAAAAPPPPSVTTKPAPPVTATLPPITSVDMPGDMRCSPDGVCSDMSDPTRWRIAQPRGPIPADAYAAGHEINNNGRQNLYVCVAYFTTPALGYERRFIGKTAAGFEGCNVPYNGREIVVTRPFLILVSPLPGPLNELAAATWVAATGGNVTGRVIQTFGEGEPLCRATHQGGTHPGRLLPGRGCAIGYGGVEVIVPSYEVLVRP